MEQSGEWLMGCEVPSSKPWRGAAKLIHMAAEAIRECLESHVDIDVGATALLLCVSEPERPGRPIEDDADFLADLQRELGLRFHRDSRVVARGHVSTAVAIQHARQLLGSAGEVRQVLVAATDTLLIAQTLAYYEAQHRLLTSTNSDGFIAGEAAAAFVLEPLARRRGAGLICQGVGFGVEKAHIASDEPLRADGLTAAIRESLQDAGCGEQVLKFKIVDVSGAQYHFKEASLAFSRLDRTKRTEFDVWHPADCVGEVGAAIGAVMIGVLKTAFEKGYAKGSHVLMHMGDDDGKRASLVFSWQGD
jgi:3-oxoacyl-[acyl-carrier-protein] synthase-1